VLFSGALPARTRQRRSPGPERAYRLKEVGNADEKKRR
jgi:hypothetical protein